MGLIKEYVEVKVTKPTLNHYTNLGYNCNNGDIIKVCTSDLSKGSHMKVKVQCDYCGDIYYIPFYSYYEHFMKNNKIACMKCRYLKMEECNREKYGYGFPFESSEIQDKVKNTFMDKYGVNAIGSSKEIQDKIQNTIYKKYNVKNVMSCDYIYKKQREAMLNKYGKERICVNTSKQQIKICEILNAEINYSYDRYVLDGYIEKDKIAIEYDGTGHDLQIRMGKITKEDFEIKETTRENKILQNLKLLRIISHSDKLPNDEQLKSILLRLIDILKTGNIKTLCYDLDKNEIIKSM